MSALTGASTTPSAEFNRQSGCPAGVADLLLQAARQHPRSGLGLTPGSRDGKFALLTYPALLADAQCILGGLQALGLQPGARVALLLERASDFIPAFWACLLGGFISCPLAPIRNDEERWKRHLSHVDALLDGPLLVATDALRKELPDAGAAANIELLRAAAPQESAHDAQLDEPAVLVLTSGSTGKPKAVALTHRNLLASLAGKAQRQGLSAADVTLNWISFDHVAALIEAHLLPLFVGAVQLHVEPTEILTDPLLFLRLIDRERVSMTFAPNFLFGQINAALLSSGPEAFGTRHDAFDLSSLRRIISGGEATVVETGRRFVDLLATYGLARDALWPAFGMTETCAGSVYSGEFPDADADREFASLGLPIAGLQMRIVDERGAVLSAGESGSLEFRGPMVFSQYYNDEEATRAAFAADGWFRSGDLGRIENGRLSVIGRSKDTIIVSGANYHSHELETALQKLEGIERSYVAAFSIRPKAADTEQLVVAFAASFPLDDEARLYQLVIAIRSTVILLWGFRPALILPLPKDAFPKTSLGKIQRAILRNRLDAGEYAAHEAHVAGVTTRQSGERTPLAGWVEVAIAQIYAEMFGLDPSIISATTSFFDLGGTSLDILTLTRRLTQRLGGRRDVPIMAVLQNPTVRALAARADPESRQRAKAYDPIVPLQVTGGKTPLFCIHPGVGEVLVFVNLAGYFANDRPFYALRARGFNEGERHFDTFDELVRTYVDAIRSRQPRGPYAIAGYSYGGPVALPIARMIESQGERVAFIGSIDAPPHIRHPRGEVDAVESAIMLAFFLSLINKQQMEELPNQLRSARTPEDPCAYLIRIASPERLTELDLDLPRFRAWAALAQSLSDIGHTYSPSGTVDSVTVFYAHPLWGAKQHYLESQLKNWDKFTRAPNRYIEVAGEHHTLLDPKHVTGFQAVLRAELDRALDER